jgi:integrase
MTKRSSPRRKHQKQDLYAHHIAPQIGSRLIGSIRRLDVGKVVESVVDKGMPVQANRVFSEIKAFLGWCEHKGYIDAVPALRRKDMQQVGAAKEAPRRRTLTDGEIVKLWNQVAGMSELTRDFAQLLLLTGQRLSEVREMAWEEIDLGEALWTIPGSRYKTGEDHAVPLSEPVLRILRERWLEGATGYVLAGTKEGQAFNGHASTMKRIRKKFDGRADFTWHDLRRTMRSGLSRLGVEEQTAEMAIGHMPQGIVRVYDMHERLPERRAALEKWAGFVVGLATGGDNVVPFTVHRAADAS